MPVNPSLEIEMIPAVAFARPNNFEAVGDVLRELLGVVAEKGVDFDQAIGLVAALVVFEREGAGVLPPCGTRARIRVGEEGVINVDLTAGGDVE